MGPGALILLVAKTGAQPGFMFNVNCISLLDKDFNACRGNANTILEGAALLWDSDIHRASINKMNKKP